MRLLIVLAALGVLAGCAAGSSPEPSSSLPVPRFPAPPASADTEFLYRVADTGLGRANAETTTRAGREVCNALYAGRTRQEAIEAGASKYELHPDDMRIIANVAVEVYCPQLG